MTGLRWIQVAANELRTRLRDRTLMIMALVGPIIFATITSIAFASFNAAQPVRLVVTDSSPPGTSGSVGRELQSDPRLHRIATVQLVSSPGEARARILRGDADAGIILPPPVGAREDGLPQLHGDAEVLESQSKPIAAGVAEAVLQTIGGRAWLNHVVLATLTGAMRDPPGTLRGFHPQNPVTLADQQASSHTLTAASYYGPSMAIVFLLFVVAPMAKSIWAERNNNTLVRLLASGVSRWTIVTGKALTAQLVGMLSMTVVWATTAIAFHARWGDPAGVLLLSAATVAATVAMSFGLASAVRTEERMDGLVALTTFVLVLAGGNFVPPSALPGALRSTTLLTPNGWALRGFLDLATSNGGIGPIRTSLVVLSGITVILWLAIAARLKVLMSP